MPKSVPKSIQTCYREIFSKKILCPVFHGGSSFRKFSNFFFKIPKMHKIVPKSIQTCFERVLGQTFRKIFAQFSMECLVFKSFQKNQKRFKFPKMPKIVPKRIQTCFDCNLDNFFEKFLRSFPWKVESSKIFKKKSKKIQIS